MTPTFRIAQNMSSHKKKMTNSEEALRPWSLKFCTKETGFFFSGTDVANLEACWDYARKNKEYFYLVVCGHPRLELSWEAKGAKKSKDGLYRIKIEMTNCSVHPPKFNCTTCFYFSGRTRSVRVDVRLCNHWMSLDHRCAPHFQNSELQLKPIPIK